VKLYIHSNLGCFDSSGSQVVVVPEFPIAGYYADDSLVCANSQMCFHDTSYIYPLTAAWFWVWDFGDGTGPDTVYVPTVCHTYTTGGYYHVTMCVTDSVGCSDCDSSTVIHVLPLPVANIAGSQTVCYGTPTVLTGTGGLSYNWSPPGLFSNPNDSTPTIILFQD